MPFGISPAPEEFQRRLEQALEGLEGVKTIFDDILIFGVGETQAEALANHDAKLRALFEREVESIILTLPKKGHQVEQGKGQASLHRSEIDGTCDLSRRPQT